MSPLEVRAVLERQRGSRVRVYYRTRVVNAGGVQYAVWGDNAPGIDSHATAWAMVRILGVGQHHALVQPDRHPRPVALHLSSIVELAPVILRPVG